MVDGKRVYTMNGENAESVLPAKYSVDDKYSAERIEMKKRHNIYPFQE